MEDTRRIEEQFADYEDTDLTGDKSPSYGKEKDECGKVTIYTKYVHIHINCSKYCHHPHSK